MKFWTIPCSTSWDLSISKIVGKASQQRHLMADFQLKLKDSNLRKGVNFSFLRLQLRSGCNWIKSFLKSCILVFELHLPQNICLRKTDTQTDISKIGKSCSGHSETCKSVKSLCLKFNEKKYFYLISVEENKNSLAMSPLEIYIYINHTFGIFYCKYFKFCTISFNVAEIRVSQKFWNNNSTTCWLISIKNS